MSWLSGSAFEILTIRVANFLKIELEELSQGILEYFGHNKHLKREGKTKIIVYQEMHQRDDNKLLRNKDGE